MFREICDDETDTVDLRQCVSVCHMRKIGVCEITTQALKVHLFIRVVAWWKVLLLNMQI